MYVIKILGDFYDTIQYLAIDFLILLVYFDFVFEFGKFRGAASVTLYDSELAAVTLYYSHAIVA